MTLDPRRPRRRELTRREIVQIGRQLAGELCKDGLCFGEANVAGWSNGRRDRCGCNQQSADDGEKTLRNSPILYQLSMLTRLVTSSSASGNSMAPNRIRAPDGDRT